MQLVILLIYLLCLIFVFLYSLAQIKLVINFLKARSKKEISETQVEKLPVHLPRVTIQLPIYNEKFVVEDLLENIAKIEYPKDKLEIQVLDDSTDETLNIVKKLVENLQKSGLTIQHITRDDRKDFKAGALREALKIASGEFIAIFDADFLPAKNWLQQCIPYFENPTIGVVQTRWGHSNRDYSIMTKVQAFALDYHFVLEQVGRSFGKHFINFNGTAGIWRKECILDAGNWQGDTLTEDLDLSYRAQLKGWRFKYLPTVVAPAELPIIMSAAKSQQFRWNKGAAENFQKNFGKILKNPKLSWQTKFQSCFHLLNSSVFLVVFLFAVLSLPVLFIKNNHPEWQFLYFLMAGLGVSTVVFFVGYWVAYFSLFSKSIKSFFRFLALFFSFFTVALGLSFHNSIAVLEGHFGKKSAFIRTPKFNTATKSKNLKPKFYLQNKISLSLIIEMLLSIYFAFAIYAAFKIQDFSLLIFHIMLFLGFTYVSIQSLKR